MAQLSSKHISFRQIPERELENADEVQLKSIAHSLLESKLEKMMSLSTAGIAEQLSKTKQLAAEWMRKWDLDGDGTLSSLELQGAAMEHVRLRRDYKTRGLWMIILAVLIVSCGGVILGVSIWANAISKDSEVEEGADLGGYTMRKKDGSAVVKTATALYEFALPRIGYLPFDEMSTIQSISFIYQRSLRKMTVESFKWYGTDNVRFYSPRGEEFAVTRPTNTSFSMSYKGRGQAAPVVISSGPDPDILFFILIRSTISSVVERGLPLTVDNVFVVGMGWAGEMLRTSLPPECVEPSLALLSGNSTTLEGPCRIPFILGFGATGLVEAAVGPQDYYGTKATTEEKAELTGGVFSPGGIFDPDPVKVLTITRKMIEFLIKEHSSGQN
eukprot:jgi/Mesvir1/14345/Mv09753-RA.1